MRTIVKTSPEAEPEAGRPLRVLVVEDDAEINDALADVLREEGFEVHCARDGREALDALHGGLRTDVIVLDLVMPRMSGWEFRSLQRASPDRAIAAIPVAVVSAYLRPSDQDSLRPDAMLTKPLGLVALAELRRVAEASRRAAP